MYVNDPISILRKEYSHSCPVRNKNDSYRKSNTVETSRRVLFEIELTELIQNFVLKTILGIHATDSKLVGWNSKKSSW